MQKDPRVLFFRRTSLVLFLSALALIFWSFSLSQRHFFRATPFLEEHKESLELCARRSFYGECMSTGTLPAAVAVMIEHHPSARPQSGLSEAKVVYEMPVEGQYTRFLALFDALDTVDKIGPVRSARPYFVGVAEEYGAVPYMHVGGSADALALLEKSTLLDINEFYRGELFWRDNNRHAPHNVYTSSAMWHSLGTSTGAVSHWAFDEKVSCSVQCGEGVDIRYASEFRALWKYSSSTEKYMRFLGIEPHRDTERQIAADTVIVQFVSSTVLDDVGRLDISIVGTGTVWVFRGGAKEVGVWEKKTGGYTHWQSANGTEIPLRPGVIWVEVVNEYTKTEIFK